MPGCPPWIRLWDHILVKVYLKWVFQWKSLSYTKFFQLLNSVRIYFKISVLIVILGLNRAKWMKKLKFLYINHELFVYRDTSITATAEITSKYHFAAHMGQLISGIEGTGCHNFYPDCPLPGFRVSQLLKSVRFKWAVASRVREEKSKIIDNIPSFLHLDYSLQLMQLGQIFFYKILYSYGTYFVFCAQTDNYFLSYHTFVNCSFSFPIFIILWRNWSFYEMVN